MTEAQKETLKFYTTNDYLLINGLLWGEDQTVIDEYIQLINADGRAVMKEAIDIGFQKRWNCNKEDGEKLYKIYQKRFPVINCVETKNEIINRAKTDIKNMMESLEPLDKKMVLYRNIKSKYICTLQEGQILRYPGFSSCSLNTHIAENASYGSSESTLFKINIPKGPLPSDWT